MSLPAEPSVWQRDDLRCGPDVSHLDGSARVADLMSTLVEPWVSTSYRSGNTIAVYRRRIHTWLRWCVINAIPVTNAEAHDVAGYRKELEESGLRAPAVTARISAVSSWYRWLVTVGQATGNPAAPAWREGCDVEGCDRAHYGRGYCAKHYKRFMAHGDASVVKKRPTVPARTCTECGRRGPREQFWGDRRICKPCRPAWEDKIHRARAAAGAVKWCSRCTTVKSLTAFARNQSLCRPCNKAAKAEQQEQRRASGVPLECIGPCGQLLPPIAFDPGYRTCRRCRFENDPEKFRRHWRERRARENNAAGSHQTWEWLRLLERFGGLCGYCAAAPAETQDHVIPLVKGGSNYAANLMPACWPCNTSKHDALLAEWRYRRGGAPALRTLSRVRPRSRYP